MNKFFASIASDLNYDRQHVLSHLESIQTGSNQSLIFVNNILVLRALQSALNRTAQGSDGLPFWIVK
jgi:hypothetical protein